MTTVRNALVESILRSGRGSDGDERAAAAILWPDESGTWDGVVDGLSEELTILKLGSYEPGENVGPAIWIRTQVSETASADRQSPPPIVYMPGTSREQFRRLEDCPDDLKPLAELQFRGAFWTQANGRDWTPAAFLQNPDYGLGVQVKTDRATQTALEETLGMLLSRPVEWLRNRSPIDASTLYGLVEDDPVRILLLWLDDPETIDDLSRAEASAFRTRCKETYGFEVEGDGPIAAARKLAYGEGAWGPVWRRFREAPASYSGLVERLRQAGSLGQTGLALGFETNDPIHAWPQHNETAEASLRTALEAAATLPREELVAELEGLEATHGMRRSWVWAELGRAPMSAALADLLLLARNTPPVKQGSVADLGSWFAAGGWKADDAAVRSMSHAQAGADRDAIGAVVAALYTSWSDHAARTFQHAVVADAEDYRVPGSEPRPSGTCILFTDGMRLDIGHRLANELRARRCTVTVDTHLAALPTITATAKPALVPAGIEFQSGPALEPTSNGTTRVTAGVLRSSLNAIGYQTLTGAEVGDTSGHGWTESGSIDRDGHSHDVGLATRLHGDIAEIAGRVHELLAAGWERVEVVTDHGFLLMPHAMSKAELPAHLVELRKGRCARLGPDDEVDYDTIEWHWDSEVRWAVAPGISCYEAGKHYEHGGISLSECVVPRLTVTRDRTVKPVELGRPVWRGLRMTVEFDGSPASIDLRTKPGDPASSLLEEPAALGTGKAKAVVPNPDAEGMAAVVVALAADGSLLGQAQTLVGDM